MVNSDEKNNGTTYFTRKTNMNRVNVKDRENKELLVVLV